MPTTSRRAVLTGLGVLSPIGSDPDGFWNGLRTGTVGVRPVTLFDASALPSRVAAEVTDFDAKKIAPKDFRKSLNKMARAVQLGFCAAAKCLENGNGPHKGTIDPFRFGVEFACVMVATETDDLVGGAAVATDGTPGVVDLERWGRDALGRVPPQWMLKYLPNMPACHASILADAQGPNNTITAGDVAGLLALGEAFRITGRGMADAFLVGGCESKINPVSMTRHNTFQPLTRRNDSPATAVRPFDKDRDGTALGEAAAVFGFEELSFAQKRGVPILAEVVGFASGFDRGRKGPVFAAVIRSALAEAGISPGDVDHVNAGAGGVADLDAWEARAVAEVFGRSTPVYAPKAHFGNTGAAGGLLELAASVLALKHGELPGTPNYATPDPACPVAVHAGPPRPVTTPYALKVAYTDLGQCAAVVVRKWE